MATCLLLCFLISLSLYNDGPTEILFCISHAQFVTYVSIILSISAEFLSICNPGTSLHLKDEYWIVLFSKVEALGTKVRGEFFYTHQS